MVPRVGEPGETSMSATNKTKQGGVLGFFRRLITPTAKLSSRMKRVAVSDEAPSDEGPSDERPEPSHGPVKKVLIIDDDPVILKTASMRLKAKGYEVATATEGAEALQLLRDGAPDLILLDIRYWWRPVGWFFAFALAAHFRVGQHCSGYDDHRRCRSLPEARSGDGRGGNLFEAVGL